MIYRYLLIPFLLTMIIISAGCLSNQTKTPVPVATQTQAVVSQPSPAPDKITVPVTTPVNTPVNTTVATPSHTPSAQETVKQTTQSEQASDMGGFISASFPEVTGIYREIKKSKNALEWKEVQDQSLQLQILIQDLKKKNQLNSPNPEKNVFPSLDSRQEIVFLKYIQYLNDMENYATNLKNAVYYQEKGSDPQSAQTSRRYQGLADQFEKQAIAEVKTISDYCNDFKFTFFDSKTVDQYRYTG